MSKKNIKPFDLQIHKAHDKEIISLHDYIDNLRTDFHRNRIKRFFNNVHARKLDKFVYGLGRNKKLNKVARTIYWAERKGY